MSTRSIMLGERAEKRAEFQRQRSLCAVLQEKLHELTRPSLEVEELDTESIVNACSSLVSERGELDVLLARLSKLNRELGS